MTIDGGAAVALAALRHGVPLPAGLAALLLYACACAGARAAALPRAARAAAGALLLIGSAALMLHAVPGFRSPVVMGAVVPVWAFARTGSIGAAILIHGGVNALHFTLFTYPALESAAPVALP